MAITYTWTVESMSNYPQQGQFQNVVCVVHWVCVGTDGTYSAQLAGASGIPMESNDSDFIPYDQLTQAEVIGWVQAVLGEDGVNSVQSDIAGQISVKQNPQVATPLPW